MKKIADRCKCEGKTAPVSIACIGDSITHGCFEVGVNRNGTLKITFEPDQAYPYRLKRRLERLYPAAAVNILNAGVSGETAQDGLARLERDALSHNPDLVIVAFCLNDAMCEDVESGLKAYTEALEEMIRRIAAAGCDCIVQTPNHMCSYVASDLQDPLLIEIAERAAHVQRDGVLDRFVCAARKAAARQGVPVADAYAMWDRMKACGVDTTVLLSNSINHPAREEHEIFVNGICSVLFDWKGL